MLELHLTISRGNLAVPEEITVPGAFIKRFFSSLSRNFCLILFYIVSDFQTFHNIFQTDLL